MELETLINKLIKCTINKGVYILSFFNIPFMTAIIIVNFYRTYFPIFLNLEVQNTKIIKHCSLQWSMVLPNVLISNRYLDFLLTMHGYSFR